MRSKVVCFIYNLVYFWYNAQIPFIKFPKDIRKYAIILKYVISWSGDSLGDLNIF